MEADISNNNKDDHGTERPGAEGITAMKQRKSRLPRRSVSLAAKVPFIQAVEAYLEYRDREAWILKDYSPQLTLSSYYYRLRALGIFVAASAIRDAGDVNLDALDAKTARLLLDEALDKVMLADFTEDTIRDYLYLEARRGINARTRNARLYSFRPFFRWVAEQHSAPELDVTADVPKSQIQPGKKRAVNREHWSLLVEHLEKRSEKNRHGWRDRVLFKAMRYYGRRVGEIASLDRHSLYEDGDTLVIEYVGKGNKHRRKRLPLFGESGKLDFACRFAADLDHYRKVVLPRRYRPKPEYEKALFLSQKHMRITVRQIERVFQDLLKALRLDREGYTPHSLRHGFARAKLDDGVGLRQLQRLMDHSSIRTTEEYLDADEEELTEAMGRGVKE